MAVRAELYCYFCGHGLGEVLVPTRARRPSLEQLRTAYAAVGREVPVWDESDQPLCPRCGGQAKPNRPAKFSPEDNYGEYRRKLKRLDQAETKAANEG